MILLKALVVCCRRNGLGVIRSLAYKKIQVIAVEHNSNVPALYSRYIKNRYIATDLKHNEREFIDDIKIIGKKEYDKTKIFLIPTSDEHVLSLARYWQELRDYFHPVFETDMEILLNCLEKTRMYLIAEKAGVPYPKTYYSLDETPADLAYPLIVKPFNKRVPEMLQDNLRYNVCNNFNELKEVTRSFDNSSIKYVIQEYIPGGDDKLYSVGLFAYKGEVVAAFTGRKLRQFPVQCGECSHGEIVYEPKIIEYSKKFVSTAGYTGIAQVEFKKNNGDYYLMEINPRAWSWNSLSTYAGVNLPWIACKTIQQGRVNRYYKQKRFKGTWNYFKVDCMHNVFLNKNISLSSAMMQALKSDCHAFWELKDPGPGMVCFMKTCNRLFRKTIKKK